MSRKTAQRATSLLVMFMLMFSLVSSVFADAGNPILGTIKATPTFHANGTVTVAIRGQWNWLSHNADCNFDRAATGAAFIWNDPTESGFLVAKGTVSAEVGVKSHNTIGQTWAGFGSGTDPNPLDRAVHPVDRGNVPAGYTNGSYQSTAAGYPLNAPGDYPSGQLFVDPPLPALGIPVAATLAAWRGGCGREPMTATPFPGDPYGSWGYEATYSHTYRQYSDISQVCVNFYDVHGGGKFGKDFQEVNALKEITVDGNGDNSIDTNAYDVTDGANCIKIAKPEPTLETHASGPVSLGASIRDVATLAGGSAPTGEITFKLYGPNDATCTNGAIFTDTQVVDSGNGNYTSASFTPPAGGTYRWVANYSGDPNNAATTNGCNEDHESSVVQTAAVEITKVADASPVSAGTAIGFTVTVHNAGLGTATGVHVSDSLPADAGLAWTIASQTDAGACLIDLAGTSLTCDKASLGPDASFSVHITSPTTAATALTSPVDNSACVSATNGGRACDDDTVVVLPAAISITKVADASPVSAGTAIGFTVTVHNTGTGTATGVHVSDALPADAGTAWTIASQSDAGVCAIDPAGTLLTCDKASLAPTLSFSVHITSPTTAATVATSPVDNHACVTTTNDGQACADASVVVLAAAIEISKVADASPVSAGTAIGFTVTVHNAGLGTATGVHVSDSLPADAGLAWTIASQTDAGACLIDLAGTSLTCDKASLGPDASFSVHITSPTTAATALTSPVDNSACASATNGGQACDDDTVVVLPAAIGITKVADASPVSAGSPIGFTVTVSNTGTGTATGVHVSDALPADAGTAWTIAGQSDAGVCTIDPAGTLLTCDKASLAPTLSFSVHIVSPTSSATVATSPVDNHACVTTTNDGQACADASVVVLAAAIEISKVADASPVSAGTAIGFTVTVHNSGLGTATGVHVSDSLPADAGTAWTIASQTDASVCLIDLAGTSLTCDKASLGPDASFSVHIVSPTTAATAATSPVDNSACVSATNGGQACDDDTVVVLPAAGRDEEPDAFLVIDKEADDASVVPGAPIGFTVTVTNTGPGSASNVVIHDTLPTDAGLAWALDDNAGGKCALAAGAVTCQVGTLANGASIDFHVTSTTTAATAETSPVTNTACTTSSNAGQPCATDQVDVFLLTINKTNDAPIAILELAGGSTEAVPTADEGATVTYTLAYHLGASDVSKGVIVDVLPAKLQYVDGTATNSGEFIFQGYDPTARTLTWKATTVTTDGSVTYQALVETGAAGVSQPLRNHVSIKSDQTTPDTDVSDVYVPGPVEGELSNPTPPSTDALEPTTEPSTPGFSLVLVLAALGILVAGVGIVTPVPAAVRRRNDR